MWIGYGIEVRGKGEFKYLVMRYATPTDRDLKQNGTVKAKFCYEPDAINFIKFVLEPGR